MLLKKSSLTTKFYTDSSKNGQVLLKDVSKGQTW